MAASSRLSSEQIRGPAGRLALRIGRPAQDRARDLAVICHPHPLYGGTMDNKVVHTLAGAYGDCGMVQVRFNFRGVAGSAGRFDDGRGELDDLLAVADWAQREWPGRRLWLAGFSFGAAIAARGAARLAPTGLVLVAPPVTMGYFDAVRLPDRTRVIHGARDELVPLAAVESWLAQRERADLLRTVTEADHFFNGQLRVLRRLVSDFVRAVAPSGGQGEDQAEGQADRPDE